MSTEASDGLSRERFERALERQQLELSRAEADNVFKTAGWISEGVARLACIVDEAPATDVPIFGEVPVSHLMPADLSISESGRRLRAGTLTATELVRAHLDRIALRNPRFRAFVEVLEEVALKAAARADAELASGHDRGPLHGIPVGIKDLIDVEGARTTANSRLRRSAVAGGDAEVVRRLREGGAIVLGKLATYEFGTVGPAEDCLFAPALNPWDVKRITGGSSSGGASALAAEMIRTSIGSDTGGSLRGPASYCGVVGLKPTFGLVASEGAIGLAPSMDHLGPMSATVAEAALTLDVIAGFDGAKSCAALIGRDLAGLNIGYARNWFVADPQASPDVIAAMDDAVSQLSLLGAVIEEVALPRYEAFEAAGAAILHYESFAAFHNELARSPAEFGRKTYQTLCAGAVLTSAEHEEARRAGRALRSWLDQHIFNHMDALVTACALTTALPVSHFGDDAAWTPMRTIGFNVTGHPALALPIGLSGGLPMSMQIVGCHFGEARICQIGDAFERATGHSDVRPQRLD